MPIIGLVGPFGSGCTTVSDTIIERGYIYVSLSNKLRELYSEKNPDKEPTRSAMQDFGNEIRETKGSSYLAQLIVKDISNAPDKNYVVDSIRNPDEASYLRTNLSQFYLFGVFAEADVRWERVKHIYNDDRRVFDINDSRDSGKNEKNTGQQVTETFRGSDLVILNNEVIRKGNDVDRAFKDKINEAVDYVEKKKPFRPSAIETCMAIAYAVSMRSSCLKRKVGAVIVDDLGNVFSSGYNEVPCTQKSCIQEYGRCYRDQLKAEFRDKLGALSLDENEQDQVYKSFKESFKILDYCRALHAEENAILNVARIGASAVLSGSTLYTTTYPCNLCANKIAQVGISSIVYFEPYPMLEAKKILENQKVCQTPFEGVTYNGFFRLMEVIK